MIEAITEPSGPTRRRSNVIPFADGSQPLPDDLPIGTFAAAARRRSRVLRPRDLVIAAALGIAFALLAYLAGVANADTGSGSGSADPHGVPTPELAGVFDAAPGPDAMPPATPVDLAPHDQLHDPISSPGATWDDLKAAKKVGWPALVFAIAFLLARLLGRYGGKIFASLGKGRAAVVVAGAATALGACYDAAIAGGSWVALAIALVVAVATFINPAAAGRG